MEKYIKQNKEVYYVPGRIVRLTKEDVENAMVIAGRNVRKKARLCTHDGLDNKVHEMIIVHREGIYVRPHSHEDKEESFHVIEGDIDVVIFDQSGAVSDLIRMGEYYTGKIFYYRLPENIYHTVLIRSEIAVFHEVTSGPFIPDSTTYADWSPAAEQLTEVEKYMQKLDLMVAEYLKR